MAGASSAVKVSGPSEYIFCLTRPGSEPLLKQEVSEFHPSLRFAFSRPGIVTFKSADVFSSPAEVPYFRFARRRGLTLGRGSVDEVLAAFSSRFSAEGSETAGSVAGDAPTVQISSRLFPDWGHVGEVEAEAEGESNPAPTSTDAEKASFREESAALEAGLAKLGVKISALAAPAPKESYEFIQTDPGKWIFGSFIPGELEFRAPAGVSGIPLPEAAPSRAYLKLEEILQQYGVRVEPEDEALDLGCAPGGMSHVWIERGARVTGIDRGAVSPSLAKNSRFRWMEMNLSQVDPDRLPKRIDWVSLDVHAQPSVSLREALPLFEDKGILGFFMNLKMNRTGIVKDIPLFERDIVESLELVRWCTKQLPSNRDEVAFFGVTQSGLKRCRFPDGGSPLMKKQMKKSMSRGKSPPPRK